MITALEVLEIREKVFRDDPRGVHEEPRFFIKLGKISFQEKFERPGDMLALTIKPIWFEVSGKNSRRFCVGEMVTLSFSSESEIRAKEYEHSP